MVNGNSVRVLPTDIKTAVNEKAKVCLNLTSSLHYINIAFPGYDVRGMC